MHRSMGSPMRITTRLIPLIAAAGLVSAAPAAAATKAVDAGLPMAQHKRFWATGSSVNAFYPSRVTIRVGDRVSFRPSGFHTVHLVGKRDAAAPPFVAVPARVVAGVRDALGAPFWFNGSPQVANASALGPRNFGRRMSFSGRRSVRSGYLLGARRPMVVRFTKAGTFRFLCDYHRGMRGTVRVLPRSRRAPSAAQDARRLRRRLAADLVVARRLKATVPPAGVVDVGVAGRGGAEFYDFVPKISTIRVGQAVQFRVSPGSMETHAVAAGPGDPMTEKLSYLGLIARTFEQKFVDPRAVYPSEPPGSVGSLAPGLHGNGFWSSGMLDNAAASAFPASGTVRFTAPGAYVFSCVVHRYMHTTVYVD